VYPYGSGISYTTFKNETESTSLCVGKAAVDCWLEAGGHLIHFMQGLEAEDHVYMTVTNTGPVAGADAVQVCRELQLSVKPRFMVVVRQDANPCR
jgi:hypothetical protein